MPTDPVPSLHRIALVLEYDGTDFAGWQIQPRARTVQGEVSKAVATLYGQPLRLQGASRTDAGAHALYQVAAFTAPARYTPATVRNALNATLPPDVRVVEAYTVPLAFDPRRHARARQYRYLVWNRREASPFWRRFAYHCPHTLHLPRMEQAARLMEGTRDFASFAGPAGRRCTVRTIAQAGITRKGDLLVFTIEGNAFLPGQVRRMVGTLLEVGLGKLSVHAVHALLESPRPSAAGPAVPAHGLFLTRIAYPTFPPVSEAP
ncbi:MAG: tRNA pseudouridine(38-40) synthase TruA [Dehalococcoidia bacterium]|nr:tRNA pseudouridine(38-40) synthase TruA [Dehalococcoidia bacterium]MDW8119373.1 tRNA pseudouridine(38-40) synthase TruA [Chloroflexota bacterium]